ncbi:vWA domain-containing protein [Anoxybacillus sp. D401a]|uniref:vWA domain-containing protein n=1 Tax=Anoxybacillus sp. D401a TaxID=575112 RepID=UPI003D346B74
MNRFIVFNDKKVDSFLFMELSDLVKTLTKDEQMELEFGYQSYLDRQHKKVVVSHFWDNRPKEQYVHGLKSDVFLRTIGNFYHTNDEHIISFLNQVKGYSIRNFAKQLFMLFEDLRLEDVCRRVRPGTKKSFMIRKHVYRHYFQTQWNVNMVKSVHTDALFNFLYLLLTAEHPEQDVFLPEPIRSALPFVEREIRNVYDAKSTDHISHIVLTVVDVLNELLDADMLNTYFHLPEYIYADQQEDMEDIRRKDPLKNHDVLDEKSKDEEIFQEVMHTWHRETSDMTNSFLQFDLEQGSQTDLLGEGVRQGEAGDQALGIVHGSSQKTTHNDYTHLEQQEYRQGLFGRSEYEYGKENRYAKPIFVDVLPPTVQQMRQYERDREVIGPYQKKLTQTIEKVLEHKKIHPRTDLHAGRLNKKLLRFFMDEHPRLFYKKHEISPILDAVFVLLVDCSASMYDKMEETKKGIVLFHESLKTLRVPHKVVGFWEDTNEATQLYQPNYFQTVIDFDASLKKGRGAEIMQLEPQEDNRDGLAIRVMTEELQKRNEKQKFLLVFSDGEPAAFGYDQNGIIDTHEAVTEARKLGIEVVNVFLANGMITESQQKTIENIYGNYHVIVPNVEQLPTFLAPLLKKLLLYKL